MRIEIHNAEQAEITALTKAIERACQYGKCSADHIEIAVSPPVRTPDWLEYGISIIKNNSLSIYIAMIQRSPTAEFEFHS